MHLSRDDFLQRLSERKKRFIVDGQQFSMPRRIQELIYYDTEQRDNFRRDAHGKKQCERPRNSLKKLPISAALMAYERDCHIQSIDERINNPIITFVGVFSGIFS